MATWIRTIQGWVRKGSPMIDAPDIIPPPTNLGGYGHTPYGRKYGH
jgi:hypothetical protein